MLIKKKKSYMMHTYANASMQENINI